MTGQSTGSAGAETRRFGRAAGLLALGVGSAGVLTYVYFALAAHALPKDQYGEIVVLWSATFVTISTFFRPVEQLLSRTVAERQARGQAVGSAMRVAGVIQGSVALTLLVAALLLRGPLQDDLLGGSATLYWILVVAVTAFGASFYARGFVAGSRRFALYASILLAESCSRTAFALAVAVGIASGQTVVALGIAAAPIFSLLVVAPLAVHRGVSGAPAPAPEATAGAPGGAGDFTLARGSGFASAVLVIMLSEQALLNAGPLIVHATVNAAQAGYVFNILMVARAPLVLFAAVATSLLPHLTRLLSKGGEGGEDAFRLSVRATIAAIAAFTALTALVILVAGPALMQLAFSNKFSYDRAGLEIVALGMGLYLSASTLNQAALAQGQARRAAVCYAICAVAFIAFNLTSLLTDVRRVEVGFTAAAALLAGLLYVVYRSPRVRPEDVPEPGSSMELELGLAAADEAA